VFCSPSDAARKKKKPKKKSTSLKEKNNEVLAEGSKKREQDQATRGPAPKRLRIDDALPEEVYLSAPRSI
jgi:hypothetical protein